MFYLKLNYNQLITLKTFYFKYRKDSIDDDIHELLQDKVDSYHYQRDYKNKYKEYHTIKIDYEKLVNIYYFIEARFVWMKIKDKILNEIHSICQNKIKKYEKNRPFVIF